MSLNKVMLIGNICSDIEVRHMQNGNAVCNLSVATNEKWKDKNTGQLQEKAEFHRVVVFGASADKYLGAYAKKGQQIYVEGKLETRKWQDNSGQDKYTTEIKVDFGGKVELLGGKSDGQQGQSRAQNNQPQSQPQNQGQQGGPFSSFDDDVGF
jgi:single-strand DNA-binding protein